jgi:hypothetical protein
VLRPKKLLLFSFFLLSLYPFLFADESLTITTYFPSPYGVYNELQLYAHDPAVTTCDDAHKGTLFYKSTDDQVYVCKGTTLGWQAIGGVSYTYTYYCYNSANLGSPVCTNAGGAQGYCPSGYTQKLDLGSWGFCMQQCGLIGSGCGGWCQGLRPPGTTCGSDSQCSSVIGEAYVCAY